MMKTIRHTLLLALVLPAISHAQEEANPYEGVIKKMRDTLRTTMTQLQAAQTEAAALQAAKTESEAKIKDLESKLTQLAKTAAADKVAAEKKASDLESQLANRASEITVGRETLAKWKEGYNKAAEIARTKESERAKLNSKVIVLERKVANHERKNAEMFGIANQILKRYEDFGLGTALTMREPFIGTTRVRLQNLMQELDDKLSKTKIREGDVSDDPGYPPPGAARESKASPPQTAPASANAPDKKARS